MFLSRITRKMFRRAAWLALLAVLLPSLIPLIHHPAEAALAAAEIIHICSSMGHMSNVPADTEKAPIQKAPTCPVCQIVHLFGGGFVPPSPIVLATLPPAQEIFAPFTTTNRLTIG